jgi:uncharacterized protein
MDLDLLKVHFNLKDITPGEVEECLEDPYALKMLPESEHGPSYSRYYTIAKTIRARCLFLAFTTNGKVTRVIFAREGTEIEQNFYERLQAEY